MTAPQPPTDGSPPGDAKPDAAAPTSEGDGSGATYDFHGEKLDFDPYRFGAPEPATQGWAPTAAAAPGDSRPPAPGERWSPGQDPGVPPVSPGDYWGGAGSHRGTFPPAGYVPPAAPGSAPGDDADRSRVDLGKPADPSTSIGPPAAGPPSTPPGYPSPSDYPSPSGYPSPSDYPSPSGYPSSRPPAGPGSPYGAPPAPGAYPGRVDAPGANGGGNGLAVAGFIVSLAALALFWTYFIASLIGLVGTGLSIAGLVRARRGARHRSLAVWGIGLGILAVVIGIAITVYVFSRVDLQCVVDLNGDTSRAQECIR